ncbi:hypoxanthine phosphoribosyltransferase [Cohaesibacter celericrescens]|uniref:Hypoxanthine phosphoribosyltransferase n=1 Tax=Cohaesibacter celericrescens TaxID=2067669 RepID=A0A2N5XUC3_9HYPH|nr:hypoxanthine phosphoribosyltransferase [Cohaesibacter celericrescens]PLW78057.1 hypoxanthine phosphoribosyltransferase [Cohaesibacter celericrescens]
MTETIHVLYDEATLEKRNQELAASIAAGGYKNLLVIAVLKGSFVFAADLLRALYRAGVPLEVEFMSLSSYGSGTKSTGHVKVVRDIETIVEGRDVLLIDDILESGRTLAYAKGLLTDRGASRVDIAVLLDKPGKRVADIQGEFVGFECPDKFVVGYGMDKAHSYREVPFVGYLT